MIQIGCAGEGQVSDRLQKNFGEWLKCGEHRGAEIDVMCRPCLPKLTLRLLFTSLSEFRALRSLAALLTLRGLGLPNLSAKRPFSPHRPPSAKKAI